MDRSNEIIGAETDIRLDHFHEISGSHLFPDQQLADKRHALAEPHGFDR